MKQFLKNRPVKILLIILAVLAGIALVGWLYYESKRPNYNDLQKAYSRLEIPSDWKLTKEYSVTGYRKMFCFTAGIDEACPVLNKTYENAFNTNKDPVADISLARKIIDSGGFTITEERLSRCNNESDIYYCEFIGSKGSIKINMTIGVDEKSKNLTLNME
jgi:hypothetical protein